MTLETSIFETGAGLRPGRPASGYTLVFFIVFAVWWITLCVFHVFPQIDLFVARSFFLQFPCGDIRTKLNICGTFPYSQQSIFRVMRKIFFYLPSAIAVALLAKVVIELVRRRSGPRMLDLRLYGAALTSFVIGPYIMVNLWLKTHSNRPRPYETDIFGGRHPFEPAGSFDGTCDNNCSFVSGEAAGAGWLACLILLLPPQLRPAVVPPLLAVSLTTPALRVAYGGHYLSDAVLGWLSSPVIFFGVLALAEVAHRRKYFALQQKFDGAPVAKKSQTA